MFSLGRVAFWWLRGAAQDPQNSSSGTPLWAGSVILSKLTWGGLGGVIFRLIPCKICIEIKNHLHLSRLLFLNGNILSHIFWNPISKPSSFRGWAGMFAPTKILAIAFPASADSYI